MKAIAALLLLGFTATAADAQVRRRAPRVPDPAGWVSLSVGLFNGNGVNDGATESTWDFGAASSTHYRVAAEKAFQGSSSIGVTGSYVRVPFTFIGSGVTGCLRCAAHLDAVSLGASFHVGGGTGLHQVLEGSAGAIQYRRIRADADGAELAPATTDPYFTFAYGFGYGFSRSTQLSVVQEFGLGLHERSGLTSDQSNTMHHRTLRVNLRYGFGDRNPGRRR